MQVWDLRAFGSILLLLAAATQLTADAQQVTEGCTFQSCGDSWSCHVLANTDVSAGDYAWNCTTADSYIPLRECNYTSCLDDCNSTYLNCTNSCPGYTACHANYTACYNECYRVSAGTACYAACPVCDDCGCAADRTVCNTACYNSCHPTDYMTWWNDNCTGNAVACVDYSTLLSVTLRGTASGEFLNSAKYVVDTLDTASVNISVNASVGSAQVGSTGNFTVSSVGKVDQLTLADHGAQVFVEGSVQFINISSFDPTLSIDGNVTNISSSWGGSPAILFHGDDGIIDAYTQVGGNVTVTGRIHIAHYEQSYGNATLVGTNGTVEAYDQYNGMVVCLGAMRVDAYRQQNGTGVFGSDVTVHNLSGWGSFDIAGIVDVAVFNFSSSDVQLSGNLTSAFIDADSVHMELGATGSIQSVANNGYNDAVFNVSGWIGNLIANVSSSTTMIGSSATAVVAQYVQALATVVVGGSSALRIENITGSGHFTIGGVATEVSVFHVLDDVRMNNSVILLPGTVVEDLTGAGNFTIGCHVPMFVITPAASQATTITLFGTANVTSITAINTQGTSLSIGPLATVSTITSVEFGPTMTVDGVVLLSNSTEGASTNITVRSGGIVRSHYQDGGTLTLGNNGGTVDHVLGRGTFVFLNGTIESLDTTNTSSGPSAVVTSILVHSGAIIRTLTLNSSTTVLYFYGGHVERIILLSEVVSLTMFLHDEDEIGSSFSELYVAHPVENITIISMGSSSSSSPSSPAGSVGAIYVSASTSIWCYGVSFTSATRSFLSITEPITTASHDDTSPLDIALIVDSLSFINVSNYPVVEVSVDVRQLAILWMSSGIVLITSSRVVDVPASTHIAQLEVSFINVTTFSLLDDASHLLASNTALSSGNDVHRTLVALLGTSQNISINVANTTIAAASLTSILTICSNTTENATIAISLGSVTLPGVVMLVNGSASDSSGGHTSTLHNVISTIYVSDVTIVSASASSSSSSVAASILLCNSVAVNNASITIVADDLRLLDEGHITTVLHLDKSSSMLGSLVHVERVYVSQLNTSILSFPCPVANSNITVVCAEVHDTASTSFLQFDGPTTGVVVELHSVAIHRSNTFVSLINISDASSTSNTIRLIHTSAKVPMLVASAAGAAGVSGGIMTACSSVGTTPMSEGSFSPALVPLVSVNSDLCDVALHPSCWSTATQSISTSMFASVSTNLSSTVESTKVTEVITISISPTENSLTINQTSTRTLLPPSTATLASTLTRTRTITRATISLSPTNSSSPSVSTSPSPTISGSPLVTVSVTSASTYTISSSSPGTLSTSVTRSPTKSTSSSVTFSLVLIPTGSLSPSYSHTKTIIATRTGTVVPPRTATLTLAVTPSPPVPTLSTSRMPPKTNTSAVSMSLSASRTLRPTLSRSVRLLVTQTVNRGSPTQTNPTPRPSITKTSNACECVGDMNRYGNMVIVANGASQQSTSVAVLTPLISNVTQGKMDGASQTMFTTTATLSRTTVWSSSALSINVALLSQGVNVHLQDGELVSSSAVTETLCWEPVGTFLRGNPIALSASRLAQQAGTDTVAWSLLIGTTAGTNTVSWVPASSGPYGEVTVSVDVQFRCAAKNTIEYQTATFFVDVAGFPQPSTTGVEALATAAQIASALASSGGGAAAGRVMAGRTVVECSSGVVAATSARGPLRLSVSYPGCDEHVAAPIYRGTIIGNLILQLAVGVIVFVFAVYLSFNRDWSMAAALRHVALPSSLMPVWVVVLPSTATATAQLIAMSGCAGDVICIIIGIIIVIGPTAGLGWLYRWAPAAPVNVVVYHGKGTLATVKRMVHPTWVWMLTKGEEEVRPSTAMPPMLTEEDGMSALFDPTVLSKHNHQDDEHDSNPHQKSNEENSSASMEIAPTHSLRHATVILREYTYLSYALLEVVVLIVVGVLVAISGHGGATQCTTAAILVAVCYLLQMIACAILTPFTTTFGVGHGLLTLFLTLLSAILHLLTFTVANDSTSSASLINRLSVAASALDFIVIFIVYLHILIDLYALILFLFGANPSAGPNQQRGNNNAEKRRKKREKMKEKERIEKERKEKEKRTKKVEPREDARNDDDDDDGLFINMLPVIPATPQPTTTTTITNKPSKKSDDLGSIFGDDDDDKGSDKDSVVMFDDVESEDSESDDLDALPL